MNADKTYNVREIFTMNYYEIVVAGEAVKNYDEEGRTYNFIARCGKPTARDMDLSAAMSPKRIKILMM